MGKRGGRVRAQRLSAARRREIAVTASAEAKKRRNKRQKRIHELLEAIYDNLGKGWKIYPNTPLGNKGSETILMRVAELLREFANKKSRSVKEIPNGSPNSRYVGFPEPPPKAEK